MKKKTGEFAWVSVSLAQCQALRGRAVVVHSIEGPPCDLYAFCEKVVDIDFNVDKTSWQPVPIQGMKLGEQVELTSLPPGDEL